MAKRIIHRTTVPRSRKTDPDTSHWAGAEFEKVHKIKPDSLHHRVLSAFAFVTDGLTGPEMQEELGGGLDIKETTRKRINELERWFGVIKKTGVTRPNYRSGRNRQCHVYVITNRGIRALYRLNAGKAWP